MEIKLSNGDVVTLKGGISISEDRRLKNKYWTNSDGERKKWTELTEEESNNYNDEMALLMVESIATMDGTKKTVSLETIQSWYMQDYNKIQTEMTKILYPSLGKVKEGQSKD